MKYVARKRTVIFQNLSKEMTLNSLVKKIDIDKYNNNDEEMVLTNYQNY